MSERQSSEERKKLVRLLLRSRFDYLPGPSSVSLGALPGPAPSRRVPCGACNKTGSVPLVHSSLAKRRALVPLPATRFCPSCGGSGWRKRNKGEKAWDEYLEAPVRDETQRKQSSPRGFRVDEDIRRLSTEIDRLDRQRQIREGDFKEERYAWEIRRDRQHRQGSYRELGRALGRLEERSRAAYNAITYCYEFRPETNPAGQLARWEDLGVTFVAQTMRGEIRIPAHLTERVEAQDRKHTAAELLAGGMSVSKVAKFLGLRKQKVKEIAKAITPNVMPSGGPGIL